MSCWYVSYQVSDYTTTTIHLLTTSWDDVGGSELIMSWEVNLQYRILLFMMMVILTFDCTNPHCC